MARLMPERTLAGIERRRVVIPEPEIEQAISIATEREVAITIDEWLKQNAPTGKRKRSSRQRVPEAQLVLF